MAALAIPIVVLGSLYILSEQEKKSEGFTNEVVTEQQEEELQKEGFSNYNPRKIIDLNQKNNNYINSYTNPNQHTDKYFDPTRLIFSILALVTDKSLVEPDGSLIHSIKFVA